MADTKIIRRDRDDEGDTCQIPKSDLHHLEKKIDALDQKIDHISERNNSYDVWKATIEGRLAGGAEKFADIKEELKERVEKKVLFAYLLGAAFVGSLSGVGIFKMLFETLGGK